MSAKPPTPISSPPLATRVQRFHVRANFAGNLRFVCPYGGYINVQRLFPAHWRVYCQGECCDGGTSVFIPTINLAAVGKGPRLPPPDYVVPEDARYGPRTLIEAFPMGDLERWKSGRCVHTFTSGRGASEFVNEVRARAASGQRGWKETFDDVAKEWGIGE